MRCTYCGTWTTVPPDHLCRACRVACFPPEEQSPIGPVVAAGVKLPAMFYYDHQDRGCPAGRVVRKLKRHVVVDLDAAGLADLRSDAEHYASIDDYEPGLRASARATLAALGRAGL